MRGSAHPIPSFGVSPVWWPIRKHPMKHRQFQFGSFDVKESRPKLKWSWGIERRKLGEGSETLPVLIHCRGRTFKVF